LPAFSIFLERERERWTLESPSAPRGDRRTIIVAAPYYFVAKPAEVRSESPTMLNQLRER